MMMFRDKLRMTAGVLVALLVLAFGPFAHGAMPAAQASGDPAHAEMPVMATGHHHVNHQMPEAEPAAPRGPHHTGVDCCDDLGLCAATALIAGADESTVMPISNPANPLPEISLADLHNPWLDLPPPRSL